MTTFLDTVLAIQRTARAISERMDKDGPCTMRQFEVLHALADGTATMGELAESIGATPATLTQLVDRLQRDGLVSRTSERRKDAHGIARRVTRVGITVAGRGAYDEAKNMLWEWIPEKPHYGHGDLLPNALRDFVTPCHNLADALTGAYEGEHA